MWQVELGPEVAESWLWGVVGGEDVGAKDSSVADDVDRAAGWWSLTEVRGGVLLSMKKSMCSKSMSSNDAKGKSSNVA